MQLFHKWNKNSSLTLTPLSVTARADKTIIDLKKEKYEYI